MCTLEVMFQTLVDNPEQQVVSSATSSFLETFAPVQTSKHSKQNASCEQDGIIVRSTIGPRQIMQDGSYRAVLRSSLFSCGSLYVLLELLIVVFRLTRDAMLTFSLSGYQGKVQVSTHH